MMLNSSSSTGIYNPFPASTYKRQQPRGEDIFGKSCVSTLRLYYRGGKNAALFIEFP